ncbi:tetratricopeptide repeat protein [Microbulbifer thermotolerans]|uniref:Ancillary SecYEG translocon subunit n=1 Tax=Microbulbifer thermotolerans TaxID=252514 RepID=A0AB35HZB0_MICTH|nr:tetratricopeptide repeat protein [Microbulbifer thermotolerans]MCX2784370.1 tetratricopeptide repeat protein [Microbulbifer thermotolerans]MCX2795998.1 tetratricopeptide repeat protein [Microbulbifer thermotolerans]MCX2801887.1 tetratricopeptide repeat protein [Microbulbifer thermotolerans]MCX2831471.1 tetratricopeptide repeat protein [Microbulbifer thermotolerans]MCX2843090.1 tetratricopeptide repeat protein [Microbulbifer thermotolerans]
MADHLTEQEQIETLKRWWAENGKGIVTGVVLALAGYFGYQWWQNSERAKAEEASNLYQNFVEAVSANGGEPDNKQMTTAKSISQQLKDEFPKGIYASHAALRLAAEAAEENDLESAEKELQWVLDNTQEETLKLLAKRRLAAVMAARGKPDEGLKLLEGAVPSSFAALFAETRGDILLQKGEEAGARAAYQQALAQLLPEQAESAQLLRLKAESLSAQDDGAEDKSEAQGGENEVEPADAGAEESSEQ